MSGEPQPLIPACPPSRQRVASADLKSDPEDFVVDEVLPFAPTGQGEFLLVQVRKINRNTSDVANDLARWAGRPSRDVSYAGRKDSRAVTTQWFSIHLPGKSDPDSATFSAKDCSLIDCVRHQRKLRTGALAGNRFKIRLRNIEGSREDTDNALESIAITGVPNYFGPQRFGNGGRNLFLASRLAAGGKVSRGARSMALSAARAAIFNEVLAIRVAEQTWDAPGDGEIYMFADGTKCFGPLPVDAELRARQGETRQIDLTGPLWGEGQPGTADSVREMEAAVASRHPRWRQLLERFGLRQERRRLRLVASEMRWEWIDGDLEVAFFLPRGTFATTFLGEVVEFR